VTPLDEHIDIAARLPELGRGATLRPAMSGEPDPPSEPGGSAAPTGEVPATLKREGHTTLDLGTEVGAPANDRPGVDLPRLAPGERVAGRFTILRFVARGGMGAVYEANDVILQTRVALKTLQGAFITDAGAMERFRREVLLARRVSHPNVCRVYELYEATTLAGASVHLLTMEFLDGETLAARIGRQGRLTTAQALPLVRQMCAGLAAAHAEGVIHRDFKSGNVLLVPRTRDSGHDPNGGTRVVLTDFGVARALEPDGPAAEGLTGAAGILGTPAYMAPEQVTGGPISPATDVYALGVVMYEMVCGKVPFSGPTPLATAVQHVDEPPPRPEAAVPGLDPRWSHAIRRCLDRDPRRRFQDASEVLAALSTRPPRRRLAFATVAVLAVLLGAAIVARQTRWSRSAATQPSVAVLPFVDMSADHDQEYFSDGVAQEIINALAQVPGLHVVARSSSFSFKGKNEDLRSVGQKLEVAHVLEGSVRKSGNHLRVTAQLVNAADGYQLWSQSFDRDLADVFAVQDEIARAVVAALSMKVLVGPGGIAQGRRVTSPEAYTHYLRALQLQNSGSTDGLKGAIDELQQTIQADPGYAPAHARLAEVVVRYDSSIGDAARTTTDWRRMAVVEAERAVELGPDQVDGYEARGLLRTAFIWDWSGARADLEKAISLSPGSANAQIRYAQLMAVRGRLGEAIETGRKAVQLDPLSPETRYQLGSFYNAVGDYALARETLKVALVNAPRHGFASRELAFTELLDGHPAEALAMFRAHHQEWVREFGTALAEHSLGHEVESRAALDRLHASNGRTALYQIAQIHAWRGENDLAFEWLERARLERDPGTRYLKYDPFMRPLRKDPRYAELLTRMKLPLD
jgi:serine/threonine-protein kinase